MRIAYLVLAYKDAGFLKREVDALSTENCTFFIHIDLKSDIEEFSAIKGRNIVFIDRRIPVFWAEFSGVEAALELMRQAMEDANEYDYFILLSGSEYPLRSNRYIESFLERNRGTEFMSLVKMPNEAAGKPLWKINRIRVQSNRPARRFAMRVLAKIGLAQRDYRKYLGGLEPYSGDTWWALSREACAYILQFVERNKQVSEYFRSVFVPEESFFHTILGNSRFSSRLSRNFVYEDWSALGEHPAMVGERHMALFEGPGPIVFGDVYGTSEMLFARKFCDATIGLLDRLEKVRDVKDRIAERR